VSDDTLLEFPCDFPIKIMGRESHEFQVLARELVEKYTGALPDDSVVSSLSRNGSFVSVTVTVTAQSQQQLDEIYRELTAHDDVLMAL
jgi:putative lipoic acid-binding regulatory protein